MNSDFRVLNAHPIKCHWFYLVLNNGICKLDDFERIHETFNGLSSKISISSCEDLFWTFFMTKFNFSKTNSSPEIPSWKIKLMQSKQKTLITIIWIFIMILAAAAAVVVFLLLNIFSHIQANFFMTSLLLKLLTPFIIFFVWWVLICVDVALRCRIIFLLSIKWRGSKWNLSRDGTFFLN